MTIVDHWPLFGMRIKTESVELRVPTDDDLLELLKVARGGVHDPSTMPFLVPWTDQVSPEFERSFLQYHWGCRARWSAASWDLNFVVVVDGRIVGSQGISAANFAILRTIETGSWLGLEFQGQGIGKAMRSAVVAFAFEYLGAERITSGAFFDNPASQRVSQATGYEANGSNVVMRRGVAAEQLRFVLTKQSWGAYEAGAPITVEDFEPCRPLFGLTESPPTV
jgi:RimJ/RimL family protein N-acetyltransferase